MGSWKSDVDKLLAGIADSYWPFDRSFAVCLTTHPIARLIAALPSLAGCVQAADVAKTGLGLLIKAARYPSLNPHARGMTLRDRLRPIEDTLSGAVRPDIVRTGMALLELASLQDHRNDLQEDRAKGKPNPLDEGLDYDEEVRRLQKEIEGVDCPEMDEILSPRAILSGPGGGTRKGWFC